MAQYTRKDAAKAIILFIISMIIPCIFDGLPPLTTLSYELINVIKLVGIILGIIICLLFVLLSRQSIDSLGIHKSNLLQSIIFGILSGLFLILLKWIFSYCMGWKNINIMIFQPYALISFCLAAIEEEIVFRGYIQTRLSGVIQNNTFVLIIVAGMFLIVHYPVMWMVGGSLPLDRVIWLIILSFVCGIAYKKTNNVWSAIIAHLLYNLVTFY